MPLPVLMQEGRAEEEAADGSRTAADYAETY